MSHSCRCEPFKTSKLTKSVKDHYGTSSKYSHYYENVVDHSLNHLHIKRESRQDLKFPDAVMLVLNESDYNRIFHVKYWDDRKLREYRMNRFRLDEGNFQSLHEGCMRNPIIPMKFRKSTTTDHYSTSEEIRVPSLVPQKSPVEDSTCAIQALGREEFPLVPANSPGYSKHLDIYACTTQLAHHHFTSDQQNGVARKDIQTFYDTSDRIKKCRGFGPRNVMPIGGYFHKDKTAPNSVRMRSFCRVPNFGKMSEYREKYDHVLTNLMHRHEEIPFPLILRADKSDIFSVPAMYCTENCHLGTGWPVQAAVHIAKYTGHTLG